MKVGVKVICNVHDEVMECISVEHRAFKCIECGNQVQVVLKEI